MLLLFIFGLLVGSFLNVIIHRLPRGESIVLPPSRCPHCGGRLSISDLVPLFSYLWLRGRCRRCGTGISLRYPLVELLTGVLFVSLYAQFGLQPLLAKHLFLASLLVAVAFIDMEHYLIPNRVVLVGLAGGVPLNLWVRDLTFLSAVLGALVPAAFFFLLALATRGGVGGGDIKLAAVIGLFLGWPWGLLAVFLGALAGGILGLALLLTGRKKRKDPLPFGPFIALGAIVTVFAGEPLVCWYLSLTGLTAG
ncbi:MAG: prepilin peptidase [Thermoanaerobacterales bacterium]|nr:prepilin peptidase [Bacillota bacterium]MDI6906742.1 prepilin peptidase [Thermoanaerobacterales bacterium]